MMTEKVLWGHKQGEPDWMESVITSTTDPQRLEAAKKWAIEQGFTKFRIQVLDGKVPDFAGTLNIGRKRRSK